MFEQIQETINIYIVSRLQKNEYHHHARMGTRGCLGFNEEEAVVVPDVAGVEVDRRHL